MSYRFWTADESARVASLWADGLTSFEIGAALDRTRSAIAGQARRMGLPKRRPGRRPRGSA